MNGSAIEVGSGLEGRIASAIERNGLGSCVIVQVGIEQRSYIFAFPRGCAGGGGGGGGMGSAPPELNRLNKTYQLALENLERTPAANRRAVLEFIKEI